MNPTEIEQQAESIADQALQEEMTSLGCKVGCWITGIVAIGDTVEILSRHDYDPTSITAGIVAGVGSIALHIVGSRFKARKEGYRLASETMQLRADLSIKGEDPVTKLN